MPRRYSVPRLQAGSIDEPARDPHGQPADTARIAADVDDEALAVAAAVDGIFEGLGQCVGLHELVESHVSDVRPQPCAIPTRNNRGACCPAHHAAARLGAGECPGRPRGRQPSRNSMCTGCAGRPLQPVRARIAPSRMSSSVESANCSRMLRESRARSRSPLTRTISQPGLTPRSAAGEPGSHGGDEGMSVDHAHVDAGGAIPASRSARRVGHRSRSLHLPYTSPGNTPKCVWWRRSSMEEITARASPLVLAVFDFGTQLIVHGLPVQAAEFGVPVLIPHGLPDVLERIDIGLTVRGAEFRLAEDQGGPGADQHDYPKAADHSSTVAYGGTRAFPQARQEFDAADGVSAPRPQVIPRARS